MPVKSKLNAKSGSTPVGAAPSTASKTKAGSAPAKVAAPSKTFAPTNIAAAKAGAPKSATPKTGTQKSAAAHPAAPSKSKISTAPAVQKSQSGQRPAAVSTQKPDTVKLTQQQRTSMATPSSAKAAPAVKSSMKGALAKAAPTKAAPVAAKAAVKAAHVAAAKIVPPVVAAQAAAARPAAARAMPAAVATPAAQRISSPVTPVAAVLTPKDIAIKAQQAQQAQQAVAGPKKPVSIRHGFKTNEWIVYPAHGVGRIVAIEEQEIAGMALELFVITFEKDKMTLRVPTGKCASVGMRKLAEDGVVKRAMETLKGKARIKRTMWSRRAQEFEQKINSGDLVSIAEVVRDLFRAETQPEQSYSERQLYEAALDRMAREIAAVEKIDERGAVQRVTEVLSKSAKTRRAESDAAAAGDIKAA
jgi:CarD family transcriptional regulator